MLALEKILIKKLFRHLTAVRALIESLFDGLVVTMIIFRLCFYMEFC